MQIRMPDEVSYIIEKLNTQGFSAYAVGGCVRDSILGRVPDDWDITTDARPEEIKKLFRRTVDTGIAHGTVTVMLKEKGFEVTTYRIDGEYKDGRHPQSVAFTSSLAEDLCRRDFTINAMAYNDTEGLIDLFDGCGDLHKKLIRCVGDPAERFAEDALRMLRAVRFSAQLDFAIEEKTAEAISLLSSNLEKISAERIMTELTKTILSGHPEVLRKAFFLGETRVFLPEFDVCMETVQNTPHHAYTVGEHILKTMEGIEPDRILRFTMLLHDFGKPVVKSTDENGADHFVGHPEVGRKMAEDILKRLKCDNETLKKVCTLVKYHDVRTSPNKKSVRRLLSEIGPELFFCLMKVQKADIYGQSDYQRAEKLDRILKVEKLGGEILSDGECFSVKDLAINGNDLIALGYQKGPGIGEFLKRALEEVLLNPENNTKAYLTKLAADEREKEGQTG